MNLNIPLYACNSTRPFDKNTTDIAFVSVNYGKNIGNWKDINKDLSDSENEKEKREFKNVILDRVMK